MKAAMFAFEGLLKPESLRTNCSDAARISSSVAGGSKLNSVLMFLHMLAFDGGLKSCTTTPDLPDRPDLPDPLTYPTHLTTASSRQLPILDPVRLVGRA